MSCILAKTGKQNKCEKNSCRVHEISLEGGEKSVIGTIFDADEFIVWSAFCWYGTTMSV